MPLTLTNITTMAAARYLNAAQSAAAQAIERLSSGKRINSAKDDPAGFAIASRMTAQINGMNQAVRNARDGISLAQTAEGALSTTADMLQRVRVLAIQASNTTNIWDRQAIQEEASQLIAEIDRTAQTLQFNGRKILDGSSGTLTFQIGPNAGDTVSYAGTNMLAKNYGNYRIRQAGPPIGNQSPVTGGDITLCGSRGTATFTARKGDSAKTIAQGINSMSAQTGVTASARTEVNLTFTAGCSYTLELAADNGQPVTLAFSTGTSGVETDDLAAAVNAINAHTAKTGVTAQVDTLHGGIRLTHETGSNITLANTSESAIMRLRSYCADGKPDDTTAQTLAYGETGVAAGTLTYDSPYGFTVTDQSGLKSDGGATTAATLHAVSSIDLSTFEGAQLAIAITDSALNAVNRERSRYGAMQSRFGYTIDNLMLSAENLSAARSRIEDTDYAAETAALARSSILMQAATAMIAHANLLQQNLILSLLEPLRRH